MVFVLTIALVLFVHHLVSVTYEQRDWFSNIPQQVEANDLELGDNFKDQRATALTTQKVRMSL